MMNTVFLAAIPAAVSAGSISGVVLRRYLRSRRRMRGDLERVYSELRLAQSDPLLIHQARRRLRRSEPHDRR